MPLRAGLTTATVTRAAADLLDTEGADALTLARVAEKLGVRIPSLYNHVAGLDGLRRELALYAVEQLNTVLTAAAIGKAGDDAVYALANAYRAFVKAHPALYPFSQRIPHDDPALQAAASGPVDVVVAVLAGYGLRADDALHAVRGFRSALHGFTALEAMGGFGLPLDLDESFRRLIQSQIAGLRAQANGAQPGQ